MFFIEQDVRVLFEKLAQKTYELHKNNAKSICIWFKENTNSMFYHQKVGEEMDGHLIGQNMPFILGIQTPWQREMIVEYWHQGGVAIDTTFQTNEKKVIHSTCTMV
jgi:hypothetical protein